MSKNTSKQERPFSQRERRIYNFLHDNPVGVLSTVDPDGNPHGVVIYYTVDRDFIALFLTRVQTRKFDNLKHNNRVTLTVFDEQTQTTAQIIGKAVEIRDNLEINRIAQIIQATSIKNNGIGLLPVTKLAEGRYTAFKIKPVQVQMAVYAPADEGGNAHMFDSVESFDLETTV